MASSPLTACNKTEVIIIGNGPSGICMSFLLSGHWPYYRGSRHPNGILHQKLTKNGGLSLIEQDLDYLSEGLEGRSPNPVSLLFDTLTHADADVGVKHRSFLTWKKDESHSIPHVVLGNDREGGVWQKVDGDLHTVSLKSWMELPSLPIQPPDVPDMLPRDDGEDSGEEDIGEQVVYERANVAEIRDYFSDFVRINDLKKYFKNYSTVTSVRKIYNMRNCVDGESGEIEPCCKNVKKNHTFFWEVRGYRSSADGTENSREDFCYLAPNIVLATGVFDDPNWLRVPGEYLPFVLHSVSEYESALKSGEIKADDSVVIIGAGLSAADAVLISLKYNVSVEHVFRQDPHSSNSVFSQLPRALYPEYHRVHEMMKGDSAPMSERAFYQPHQGHSVASFSHDGKVMITRDDQDTILHCSHAVVLIGSHPNLSFLPDDGRSLGVVPRRRIHATHNPVDIDPFSYQSVHEPGLFAIGPLVGDTFVRFIKGGSLGVCNHLWKKKQEEKHD